MKSRTRAFTLIELLVVISIIALLLAILVPALREAKAIALRVICGKNCRSTGTALVAYTQDYDGKFPPQFGALPSSGFVNLPWVAALAYIQRGSSLINPEPLQLALLYENEMVGNPETFYCPAQPRNSSYPIPYNYDFYTKDGDITWGDEIVPIPDLAGHIFVRTSYNYWLHGKEKVEEFSTEPILVDNCQEWEVLPHRKSLDTPRGLTALFADGHVSFCTNPDIFNHDYWPRDFTTVFNGPGNDADLFEKILDAVEAEQ